MVVRLFWRRFHLWLGVICGLFLLAISLSGAVLVFSPEMDRWLHPALYAVTGASTGQSMDVFLTKAAAAVPDGVATQLRWPEAAALPITLMMRLGGGGGSDQATKRGTDSARPRMMVVYLDPPTGEVLGTADPRASIAGIIRSLHTDLCVPGFGGRQIVGWNGAALFILCASGLYLWWPRHTGLFRGLRWRRGPTMSVNLHHRVGFWIALPLAVMAFTGIFQAFQQPGRAFIGMFASVNPQPARQGPGASPLAKTHLTPQQVIDMALKEAGVVKPSLLTLPTDRSKVWRLQVEAADGNVESLLIDDATAAVTIASTPLRGDMFLAFMRRIHEGRHDGLIWKSVVILSALAPALLFVTGLMIWLRRRRHAAVMAANTGFKREPIAARTGQGRDQNQLQA